MSRKLAVKRLTASDLTFFVWHFENRPAGNQKAINLNADVFIHALYPSLPEAVRARGGKIPIDLYLYGPGLQGEYNLQRKIIKKGMSYKNWRLDGEYVQNPPEAPERFNCLTPGDMLVLQFDGEIVFPTALQCLFLAHSLSEDQRLHMVFDRYVGTRKMATISSADFSRLVGEAEPPPEHPVNEMMLDEALEEAAQGGFEGTSKLTKRKSGYRLSKEDLLKAKADADNTGHLGEEYVCGYLQERKNNRAIKDFEWISESNAASPFDFKIVRDDGDETVIEVKTTLGEFRRRFHVSYGELYEMTLRRQNYHLYRVFEIGERHARMRIADSPCELADGIMAVFSNLPEGVIPDSVSINPSLLDFGEVIEIQLNEGDEE